MPNRPVSEFIRGESFVTVLAGARAREAAQLMKEHHTSAVLVVNRNQVLVGICTERDIVIGVLAEGLDPDKTPVSTVMTERTRTITADKPFGHALHLMYEGGFRHVPVVNDKDRPIGILSSRDALKLEALEFSQELVKREEITVIL